jgi:hypothetical protein
MYGQFDLKVIFKSVDKEEELTSKFHGFSSEKLPSQKRPTKKNKKTLLSLNYIIS